MDTTLHLPFTLHERNGEVEVHYATNDDVVKSGFDILKNLNFDPQRCLGYPTMHARIAHYGGTGYRTACCWIQVITDRFYATPESKVAQEISVGVDCASAMKALGVPFFSYGYLPEIYDAPCNNLGSHSKLECVADTFLTSMPSRANGDMIHRLAGFRWGYIESDVQGQRRVELLPLQVTTPDAWNKHLALMRNEFPAMHFATERRGN